MDRCPFIVGRYPFIVNRCSFIVNRCPFIVGRYPFIVKCSPFIVDRYSFIVDRCSFTVQYGGPVWCSSHAAAAPVSVLYAARNVSRYASFDESQNVRKTAMKRYFIIRPSARSITETQWGGGGK